MMMSGPILRLLESFGSEPAGISSGVTVTVTDCPGGSDEPVGATDKKGNVIRDDLQVLVTLDGFVIVNVSDVLGTDPQAIENLMA